MEYISTPSHARYRIILAVICMLALAFLGLYQLGIQPATAYTPYQQPEADQSHAAAFQVLPAISFQSTGTTVGEGIGSITVQVQISQAPTATATVRYISFAGSAGTSDYVAVQGTLTFPTASTGTQNITVQITDDGIPEPPENFRLFLYEPVNARVVAPSDFTIVITDNDPTVTPTPTGGAPIFADALEPNNNFNEASNVDAGGAARCNLTFYPPGDQDFFRWWGQAGISYRVFTRDLDAGLDTQLQVFDTNQNLIAENDDETPGGRSSSVTFTANTNGFYFARVINIIPGDPIDKTYCFEVARFLEPTLTPPPGFPPGADACEFNSTFVEACLIVVGDSPLSLNFIPTLGSHQDTDTFRLWVKPGIFYTCETTIPAGSAADTNIILYDANTNPFNPWIGNDDKEIGDLGSLVSYLSTYTGWLFIQVGPVNVPPLEEASQHTYTLTCTQLVATPTPTATNTPPPVPTSPGGGGTFSTPTPQPTFEFPSPVPTPTPINPADFIPTPVPPPLVDVQPLPTATAVASGQLVSLDVTIFFDTNNNYLPEITEGIIGVDVSLFDNATRELLSYGQTNEAGMIHFEVQAAGTVRVVVPFLSYSQIITQSTDEVLIRVAPGTLPIGIP